ncbi:MAG: hypothetical protein ABI847_02575 [Anaerolineales bacterium]
MDAVQNMISPRARLVVLSGKSLFAEGIATRLSQQLGEHQLVIIDARESGALQRVLAAEPTAVILDASDAEVAGMCPINALLNVMPALKIVRLHLQNDDIQVVTSQRHPAAQVQDLVALIRQEL